jgi:hypothetical protein
MFAMGRSRTVVTFRSFRAWQCAVPARPSATGREQTLIMRIDTIDGLHIIFTGEQVLVSKKAYASWQEIQVEFDAYKASLGP